MTSYIERSLSFMVTFLLVLFLFSGCIFESEIPLSPPGDAGIDSALIGKWKDEDKGGHTRGTATISRFNDTELLIELHDEEKKDSDMYRAFVTAIDNEKFLNIQEIKGAYDKREWMFVNYSVADCILSYRVVDEKLIKEKKKTFASSKELYAFIKENLKDNGLYGGDEKVSLKCVKDNKPR